MPVTDCLILGFHEPPFADYVAMLRAMGSRSGAYQDVALAFVELEGQPLRALDVLTRFHQDGASGKHFHNADFLWPVVAYLTTYLERRGLVADYVNLPHLETEVLHDKLDQGPKTVAITTTLYVSPHPILALVAEVRRQSPRSRIVVGGPYITNQVRMLEGRQLLALFEYLGADVYVLCQEGEATLVALLEALAAGTPLAAVPNLAFRGDDGGFVMTEARPESNALAENILDYHRFSGNSLGEFLSLRTAKSCPYACAFCGFPQRAGKYQYLDVREVETLLDSVAETGGVTTLTFLDDTFNVPKKRFKAILRTMIRNDYGFRWNCFYRSDQGDEEAIELMARAGCEGVFLGVESGSDAMLAKMNKTARRRHYERAIPQLRAAGISTYASLILGFPGETDDTVRETMEFLAETGPEFYRAQLWYADPVTPIWQQREKYGIEGSGFNWRHATMDARRACDWIERLFLEVEASVWMPQLGFEQWSTFYLARQGMSRQQIRTFLRAFDAVIAHRLTTGEDEPTPELVEALRRSCQFEPRSPAVRSATSGVAGNGAPVPQASYV